MGVKNIKKDVAVFIAVLLLSIFIYSSVQWYNTYLYHVFEKGSFLNLHIGLEGLSIVMSFCIFFVSYYTFARDKNLRAIVFMCTFFSVGLLDTMHTLTYNGMPGIFGVASTAVATLFWVAARLTAAIGLLIAGLIQRNRPIKTSKFVFVVISLVYTAILSYIIIVKHEWLPPLFIDGAGLTQTKINLEYVIIAIKLACMFLFFLIYRRGEEAEEYKYIILSMLLSVFSELSLTIYTSVYDTYNLLGHIYKIVSYYLIFKAKFVLNVQKPYLELHKAERQLAEYANNLEKLVMQRTAEISAANEKLLKDMDYARNIQSALLPEVLPKFNKVDFAAKYLPCEKIGGDFYNIFRLDDDNIGILIGDVAGHGVSAAMITVFINQHIHVRREYDDGHVRILTPKQVLTNLFYVYNRMNFPEEIYTVLLYGIYNMESRVFTYCSAGMNTTPLILQKNGAIKAVHVEGLPICKLGGVVNPSYENQFLQMDVGDSLLLYTDGLIEIDRKRPEHFTEKHLMEYLRGIENITAGDTVDYMFDLYKTILGDRNMIDDVTVLVMNVHDGKVETEDKMQIFQYNMKGER